MQYYRAKRTRCLLVVFIILTCVAVLMAGAFFYQWYCAHERVNDTRIQLQAMQEKRDALQQQLLELQERSSQLQAEQQLQIDVLGEALGNARQEIEELDNAMAALQVSVGGMAGSTPVYFTRPDCETQAKLIALTFDDGPSSLHTPRLLDELKKRGIHATFFVVGRSIAGNESILQRMHAEGHVIGNHSMNHKNLATESIDSVRLELQQCSDLVESAVGIRPTVARMPGGNLDDETRIVLAELGLPAIGWSVDTRDWESRNIDAILKETFRSGQYGARDGAIILMHDVYDTTIDASLLIIDRLLEEGYTFVTVPELLAARKSIVLTGAVYSSAFPLT